MITIGSITHVDTGGGSYIAGDANVDGDLVGRDKYESISPTPIEPDPEP